MDLFKSFASEGSQTVGYMKNLSPEKVESDSLLLKGTLLGLDPKARLVIELPENNYGEKYAQIITAAQRGKLKMLVIPSFAHLGFSGSCCWESVIMDIAELSTLKIRVISVSDQFDSEKNNFLEAITMIAKRIQAEAC